MIVACHVNRSSIEMGPAGGACMREIRGLLACEGMRRARGREISCSSLTRRAVGRWVFLHSWETRREGRRGGQKGGAAHFGKKGHLARIGSQGARIKSVLKRHARWQQQQGDF